MELRHLLISWCTLLVVTLLIVWVLITRVDIPLAHYCLQFSHHVAGFGEGLGSPVLIACEITLMTFLAIARIATGKLSERSKAVFVGAAASLSAFVANDYVLKVIFGRKNPYNYFHDPVTHQFLFFHGTQESSFPSGHMVLATAFAVTLMRIYPRSSPTFVVLLAIAAVSLIVGDWHFAGDVVAGCFVGATAGFVAGDLWLRHNLAHNLSTYQTPGALSRTSEQKKGGASDQAQR